MQSLLSYTRAFEKDSGVRFVDVRIADITEDTVSSNISSTNSKAMYVRYIRDRKMMMKIQSVSSFRKIGKVAVAVEILGIS